MNLTTYKPVPGHMTTITDGGTVVVSLFHFISVESILRENMRALELWRATGDPIHLSALGVELSKHGGFGASRGVSKRQSSTYFAMLLNQFSHGSEDAAAICSTFCVGTRLKEVPLVAPTPVLDGSQKLEVRAGTVVACRIFSYGNLAGVACGRALTHSLAERHKHSATSLATTWEDPFIQGAIRHMFARLVRAELIQGEHLEFLFESERWDPDVWAKALSLLQLA